MVTAWLKDAGKVIRDANGRVVLCAVCPCFIPCPLVCVEGLPSVLYVTIVVDDTDPSHNTTPLDGLSVRVVYRPEVGRWEGYAYGDEYSSGSSTETGTGTDGYPTQYFAQLICNASAPINPVVNVNLFIQVNLGLVDPCAAFRFYQSGAAVRIHCQADAETGTGTGFAYTGLSNNAPVAHVPSTVVPPCNFSDIIGNIRFAVSP